MRARSTDLTAKHAARIWPQIVDQYGDWLFFYYFDFGRRTIVEITNAFRCRDGALVVRRW